MIHRITPLIVLACMGSAAFAGYDATAYFNATSNPSGPFKWAATFGSPQGLLTTYSSAPSMTGGSSVWAFSSNPGGPPNPFCMVGKSWNTDVLTSPGGDIVPRNQLFGHPSATSIAVLRYDGPPTPHRAFVQSWRPSALGDGTHTWLVWSSSAGASQTGPPTAPARGVPLQMFGTVFTTSTFFEVGAWNLGPDINYDTTCINFSTVDLAAAGPRVHGIAWLQDWVGRTEEVTADVEVRDAGNAVTGAGSGSLMSTGQFDIGFTIYEFPMVDSGYKVWIKPKGDLAKMITPVPFVNTVGDTYNLGTQVAPFSSLFLSFRGGDIDNDNEVSILDYLALSAFLGQQRVTSIFAWTAFNATYGCSARDADIDGDDEVSILDYLILSANYGLQGDL